MSCLLVDPIIDATVKQHFKIKRDIDVAHIRVNIYKHRNTVADLKLSIYQDGVLLAESKTISAAELNDEMNEDFAYGMVRFDFENFVNLHVKEGETETEYEWRLDSVGGTEAGFLATIRQYENKTFKIYYDGLVEQDEAPNDAIEPYGFEIYDYKYL